MGRSRPFWMMELRFTWLEAEGAEAEFDLHVVTCIAEAPAQPCVWLPY